MAINVFIKGITANSTVISIILRNTLRNNQRKTVFMFAAKFKCFYMNYYKDIIEVYLQLSQDFSYNEIC